MSLPSFDKTKTILVFGGLVIVGYVGYKAYKTGGAIGDRIGAAVDGAKEIPSGIVNWFKRLMPGNEASYSNEGRNNPQPITRDDPANYSNEGRNHPRVDDYPGLMDPDFGAVTTSYVGQPLGYMETSGGDVSDLELNGGRYVIPAQIESPSSVQA